MDFISVWWAYAVLAAVPLVVVAASIWAVIDWAVHTNRMIGQLNERVRKLERG